MMNVDGLIGLIMQNLNLQGLKAQPRVENNHIVIDLDEEDLMNLALRNADEKFKKIISIKVVDGKVRIMLRLY